MIFMHHVISYMKIGKALDMLAFIALVLLLFLLLSAENIALCDHRKRKHRILITAPDLSVQYHDLTGLQTMISVFCIKACDPFIHDIFCQSFGSGPRSRQ